ncbi:transcriptional regulator with XRE-family HTH domain [Streptomyces africanus]|uniref:Transcriptional regulator with XRE-family HTH domain n=1 Tax=Streptomyces africanus TaxID=231024 RepID=A0ABU0QNL3_9ACTN|nr:helix-turn-helix transcriptional regulator [Streptomyces africanus]MDQ0748961.1 transcriptional regulator with XRE-family HTH domain [Streptomyces africanus]
MDGELGDFLRSRRARIQPEEVGLASYGRRRVPGLRREEVAQLAGVSVDYYIRLEQGRGPSVSDAVLDAVARVLRLDEAEHEYLRAVARPRRRAEGGQDAARESANREAAAASRVRPGVQLILDGLDRNPAYVLDHRMDVLAWNALGDAVVGLSDHAPGERNMPRRVFLDPSARDLYPDWAAIASQTVAHLRLQAGHHPDDAAMGRLVGELSRASDDFRRLWADHLVKPCDHGVKQLRHPVAGLLTLPYETLTIPAAPDQTIVVYTPEPGSETAERLALLGSWVTSRTG